MSAPYSIDNSTELTDFIAGANPPCEVVDKAKIPVPPHDPVHLLDYNTRHKIIGLMQKYGGGFCQKLAAAWYVADTRNKQRIESAFSDYMAEYGPGGDFWTDA